MANTSVWALTLLVYTALSYRCMTLSPYATSTHMYSQAGQILSLQCACGLSLSLSLSRCLSLSLPPSPSLCVCLSLLHNHVCSRMLVYAPICSHMLAYGRVVGSRGALGW